MSFAREAMRGGEEPLPKPKPKKAEVVPYETATIKLPCRPGHVVKMKERLGQTYKCRKQINKRSKQVALSMQQTTWTVVCVLSRSRLQGPGKSPLWLSNM